MNPMLILFGKSLLKIMIHHKPLPLSLCLSRVSKWEVGLSDRRQCYKCWAFGHIAKYCQQPKSITQKTKAVVHASGLHDESVKQNVVKQTKDKSLEFKKPKSISSFSEPDVKYVDLQKPIKPINLVVLLSKALTYHLQTK